MWSDWPGIHRPGGVAGEVQGGGVGGGTSGDWQVGGELQEPGVEVCTNSKWKVEGGAAETDTSDSRLRTTGAEAGSRAPAGHQRCCLP